jgi:hypothetical protein
MELVLYPLQAFLRVAWILALSLTVFAQIPFSQDASGFRLDRKASPPQIAALPDAVIPHPPFEFCGIRIGEEMTSAEHKFLALKAPSLSSMPGLCGSDGIDRIETCTSVLDTGEYVNMTMLDQRVARIYMSTDRRTEGNSYNKYVLALDYKYGRPDKHEIKYFRNGVETGSSGELIRWLNGDQYMEGSEIERAITIGSRALDAEIAEKERLYERN